LVGGLAISITGCLTPSPVRDTLADEPPVTTPSVEGVLAANVQPSIPEGQGARKVVYLPDGTVLHRPLYFEDCAEECGSEDSQFAWTGEDFLHLFHGPVWFMANAVTFPVDAVIYPPWEVMASDGVCECRWPWLCHDSARWCGSTEQDARIAVIASPPEGEAVE
jgi:hypothetical protein